MTAPDMIICEFCGVPNERTGSCVKCGAPLPISPAQKARDDYFNRPYTFYTNGTATPPKHNENSNLFICENGTVYVGGEFLSPPAHIVRWNDAEWSHLENTNPKKQSILSGIKNLWRLLVKKT